MEPRHVRIGAGLVFAALLVAALVLLFGGGDGADPGADGPDGVAPPGGDLPRDGQPDGNDGGDGTDVDGGDGTDGGRADPPGDDGADGNDGGGAADDGRDDGAGGDGAAADDDDRDDRAPAEAATSPFTARTIPLPAAAVAWTVTDLDRDGADDVLLVDAGGTLRRWRAGDPTVTAVPTDLRPGPTASNDGPPGVPGAALRVLRDRDGAGAWAAWRGRADDDAVVLAALGADRLPGAPVRVSVRTGGALAAGDMDADGDEDLVHVVPGAGADDPAEALVVHMGPDGPEHSPAERSYRPLPFPVPAGVRILVQDVNGDGGGDLVVGAGGAEVRIAYGDGRGGFPGRTLTAWDRPTRSLARADLDAAGGMDDLAVTSDRPVLTVLRHMSDGWRPTPVDLAAPGEEAGVADLLHRRGDEGREAVVLEADRITLLLHDDAGGLGDAGAHPRPDRAAWVGVLRGDPARPGGAVTVLLVAEGGRDRLLVLTARRDAPRPR